MLMMNDEMNRAFNYENVPVTSNNLHTCIANPLKCAAGAGHLVAYHLSIELSALNLAVLQYGLVQYCRSRKRRSVSRHNGTSPSLI